MVEATAAATKEMMAAITISNMEERTSLRAAIKHCVATNRAPSGAATKRSMKLALKAAMPIMIEANVPNTTNCQLRYYSLNVRKIQ